MNRLRLIALVVATLIVPGLCHAQASGAKPAAKAPAPEHTALTPDQLQWGPPPAAIFVGKPSVEPNGEASVAMAYGNPMEANKPFVVRLKCTDGFRFAPHWHPTTENVTVLQGAVGFGMGDKYDEAAMKSYSVGSFLSVPARMHHFASCKGDTIIQIHGQGPLKLYYIGGAPMAKPAKKASTKSE